MESNMALPADYRERVYAGWVGKCAGVRLGAPVENWTFSQIRDHIGPITKFFPLPAGKIFKPDDDTAFPMILIRALEDYGPNVSAEEIGKIWLTYLGDQHGTLWWGGYGVSSEHTAYCNLAAGIPAPDSGSAKRNGYALSEQIGGQIFSDIWGFVYPGEPFKAADLAEKAASVSHDGEGLLGGRFIAALASLAFIESDPESLLQKALETIPPSSSYAQVICAMIELHKQVSNDWRVAYSHLKTHFGYDAYPGEVPIIPNAGVIALALLYGEGDFSKSICIATEAGWDTDCNAGNVGAIVGVMTGIEAIDDIWRDPMQDEVVLAGVVGTRNLMDIAACADVISDQGEKIHSVPNTRSPYRYHFSYPGSTQGFKIDGSTSKLIQLKQCGADKAGLRASVKKFGKKDACSFSVRTLYTPEELSANYYGASFSPSIYPGQKITASIALPEDASEELTASLCVFDLQSAKKIQGSARPLIPGKAVLLEFELPYIEQAIIGSVGVVIRSVGAKPWSGSLVLEYLDWQGIPHWKQDFSQAAEAFGAFLGWTYVRGYCRLEDSCAVISGDKGAVCLTGDITWEDYTVSCSMTARAGKVHALLARVQGSDHYYALQIEEPGMLKLIKQNGFEVQELESVSWSWEQEEAVELSMKVDKNKITCFIQGRAVFTIVDVQEPLLSGQVGFLNGPNSVTACYHIKVEPNAVI